MKTIFAILILILVSTESYADGPFGVEMGGLPEDYGCTPIDGAIGMYRCSGFKKRHSAFETYLVKASKTHGICLVKAIGKNISDSGYGTASKGMAANIANGIKQTYGPWIEMKDQFYGSLWDGADEFLMSVRQKERLFYYHFEMEPLIKGVKEIYVGLGATSRDTGYVSLEYYGADHKSCDAENESTEAEAF